MDDSNTFYVRRQGRTDGPWTVSKLKSEIALRKLGKHHEISTDKIVWRRAGELDELFSIDIKRKSLAKTASIDSSEQGAILATPQASAAASEWYYCTHNNQQIGPVTILELTDAVMTGRCPLDGLAWREGFGDWLPIEDVPEIRAVLYASGPGGGTDTTATRFISAPLQATRSKRAVFSIAIGLGSLFLSWIPFAGFAGLIAVIFGSLAVLEIRKSNGQKNGMLLAVLGIATGALAILVGLLLLIGLAAWVYWR
jgi:hypothetical protein